MRLILCLTILTIVAAAVGCGSGGGTNTAANNASGGPPAPPGAPAPPSAPAAPTSANPSSTAPGGGATTMAPGTASMPGMPMAGVGTATTTATSDAGFGTETPTTDAAAYDAAMTASGFGEGDVDPMPGGFDGTGSGTGMYGLPAGAGGAKKPAKPKSLREMAIDAFKRGEDQKGFEFLQTHFAIIPTAGPELAQKMAWNPGLRRPALGPRFAFGAIYNPPPDFEGSPQPIGSPEAEEALASITQGSEGGSGSGEKKSRRLGDRRRQNNAGAGAGPGLAAMPAAMPGMEGSNQNDSQGPAEELDFYTGELGTQLLDAVASRLASGDYGLVMKDLMTEARVLTPRKNPQNNDGNAAMPAGFAPMAEVGGFGDDPMPIGDGHGDARAKQDENAGPGQLAPAIAWVGTGRSKDELLRSADRAHADVLVVFEIAIQPAKAISLVRNTTKVRLLGIKDDEMMHVSSSLVNRDVMLARERGLKGEDPVEKEIARVVEALDAKFTTAELPAAVTADRARQRIQSLVAQQPDDPLAVVVEARFYAEKGLLRPDEVLTVASQALGEEKFAELLKNAPGAGMGQAIGGSVGLGGLLDLMRGVNSATDAATGSGAPATAPASKPAGGLGGLLPFSLPIPGTGNGKNGPQPAALPATGVGAGGYTEPAPAGAEVVP